MFEARFAKRKLEGGFNDCPELETIRLIFKSYGMDFDNIRLVDLEEKDYWKNDVATMIFFVPKTAPVEQVLRVMEAIHECGPDELHHEYVIVGEETGFAVRAWWD